MSPRARLATSRNDRRRRWWSWVWGLCLLSACAAARSPSPPDRPEVPCRSKPNLERVSALLDERRPQDGAPDYVVAPGDLLIVTIYHYRPEGGDFSSEVRVDDRGYVSLPMMEPVKVAGLSLAETRRALVRALRSAEVLREPLVTLFLKDYQGQQVVVLGAVNRPGMYSLSRGRQTLVDVLSMAGGLAPNAGNSILISPGQEGRSAGASDAFVLLQAAAESGAPSPSADMTSLCIEGADGTTNPALLAFGARAGDVVVIPEAGHAYVDGEVEKPGPYPLSRGVTLTQLISTAGGLTFPADTKQVKLIRSAAPGETSEWALNLDDIRAQTERDVLLERNDRVVVPYRLGRKIAYGFYYTVTTIVRVTVGGAATIF